MRNVALKDANRNLRNAERKLQVAVAERALETQIIATAELYRQAIDHYRTALLVSAGISKALRRTLEICVT
jgi:hypothetical protein